MTQDQSKLIKYREEQNEEKILKEAAELKKRGIDTAKIWGKEYLENLQRKALLRNHTRLPVGDIAQKIYDILKVLPEMQGLTSEGISDELMRIHKINLDASTIRKRHLPQLEPYGLILSEFGYCIR
ncbi:MAG: hypothetical protein ABFD79_04190 [Phycisphaerales bacterium]